MEKPVEPDKDDCCNSGCNPCIFDVYENQLRLYEKYMKNAENVKCNLLQNNGISLLKYSKFIVVKNLPVCHLHNCITFREVSGAKVWWKPGDHFLFKYTDDKNTCTRAYTPVKARNVQIEDNDFSIIVKKYDGGLVSPFLCNIKEGALTFWRGPYGHYKLEPNKFNRIIMVAQGTGIAPFITIIDNILSNEEDMTKVILLYCCKCENSILFRDELYAFQSFWNFKYDIFLSSPSTTYFKCRYQEPIRDHKLSIEHLLSLKPFQNNVQILLCGAPVFNETYKDALKAEVPDSNNIILF